MKIVVDTSIIFNALLNTDNTFLQILLTLNKRFKFYSCAYMRYEIEKYWEKRTHSKLPSGDSDFLYRHIKSNLLFINEDMIPSKIWSDAKEITKGIDIQDADFVALTIYLNGSLWTGDKYLYNGLKKMNFKDVINTTELQTLWENNSAN